MGWHFATPQEERHEAFGEGQEQNENNEQNETKERLGWSKDAIAEYAKRRAEEERAAMPRPKPQTTNPKRDDNPKSKVETPMTNAPKEWCDELKNALPHIDRAILCMDCAVSAICAAMKFDGILKNKAHDLRGSAEAIRMRMFNLEKRINDLTATVGARAIAEADKPESPTQVHTAPR